MQEMIINKNPDFAFLKLATGQAKKSVKEGGFPAGAVVVRSGEIISEGVSLVLSSMTPPVTQRQFL